MDLLKWLIANSTVVVPHPLSRIVIPEDPADEAIVACAISAAADFIISGDKHLCRKSTVEGVRVLSPAEFMKTTTPTVDGD